MAGNDYQPREPHPRRTTAPPARSPGSGDIPHQVKDPETTGNNRSGEDVAAKIPSLSTYLGHREPRYTYSYLSAAPELLAHAARLLDDAKAVWR